VKVRMDEVKARMSSVIGLGSRIFSNYIIHYYLFKVLLQVSALKILWKEAIMVELLRLISQITL